MGGYTGPDISSGFWVRKRKESAAWPRIKNATIGEA